MKTSHIVIGVVVLGAAGLAAYHFLGSPSTAQPTAKPAAAGLNIGGVDVNSAIKTVGSVAGAASGVLSQLSGSDS